MITNNQKIKQQINTKVFIRYPGESTKQAIENHGPFGALPSADIAERMGKYFWERAITSNLLAVSEIEMKRASPWFHIINQNGEIIRTIKNRPLILSLVREI